MSSAENQVNTSGDTSTCLIIKAALGNEIRKVPIVNDEITFDELLIMMVMNYVYLSIFTMHNVPI